MLHNNCVVATALLAVASFLAFDYNIKKQLV